MRSPADMPLRRLASASASSESEPACRARHPTLRADWAGLLASLLLMPVLGALVSPDRWLLWLGVLFVLAVYHFPTGVVGRWRAAALARTARPS